MAHGQASRSLRCRLATGVPPPRLFGDQGEREASPLGEAKAWPRAKSETTGQTSAQPPLGGRGGVASVRGARNSATVAEPRARRELWRSAAHRKRRQARPLLPNYASPLPTPHRGRANSLATAPSFRLRANALPPSIHFTSSIHRGTPGAPRPSRRRPSGSRSGSGGGSIAGSRGSCGGWSRCA